MTTRIRDTSPCQPKVDPEIVAKALGAQEVSHRMRLYLRLERLMLVLDRDDAKCGELLRDLMEPLWHALTGEDHAWLRARGNFENVLESHGLRVRRKGHAPTVDMPAPGGGTLRVLVDETTPAT